MQLPQIYTNIASLLAIFACTLMLYGCRHAKKITTEEVSQRISSSLSEGSTKDQVMAFLDSNQITYSKYSQNLKYLSDFQNTKLDGKRERVTGYLAAAITDVRRSFLVSYDIHLYFYFDKENRLVEHSVQEIGRGF